MSNLPTESDLYQALVAGAGAFIDRGIVSRESLKRRAEWLVQDLHDLNFDRFEILPTRFLTPPGQRLQIPLVQYSFGDTGHSVHNEKDPFKISKNVRSMDGTGLSVGNLSYFGLISEFGHRIIPDLWLSNDQLRTNVSLPTQHFDTLNEVWWLSRWRNIDAGTICLEPIVTKDPVELKKPSPPRVDWGFSVQGGKQQVNLSIKNRPGTFGSQPFDKRVYLFSNEPDDPFTESGTDELNILAITAYHCGWISHDEENRMVKEFFNDVVSRRGKQVIDAITLSVIGGPSSQTYERVFTPETIGVNKFQLLETIWKTPCNESISQVWAQRFPREISRTAEV